MKVYSIKYLTKMTSPSWKQVGGYNRTIIGNYARFSYLTNETDSDKYSTSATSVAYTLGSGPLPPLVTFNTLPGLAYTPGQKIIIAHDATNYFTAYVNSYSGNILNAIPVPVGATGTGSYSTWQINLDGIVGPLGPTGPRGGTGPQGIQGIQGIHGTPWFGVQCRCGPQTKFWKAQTLDKSSSCENRAADKRIKSRQAGAKHLKAKWAEGALPCACRETTRFHFTRFEWPQRLAGSTLSSGPYRLVTVRGRRAGSRQKNQPCSTAILRLRQPLGTARSTLPSGRAVPGANGLLAS